MWRAERFALPLTAAKAPHRSNSQECSVDRRLPPQAGLQDWHALARKERAIASPPASPPCEVSPLGSFHQRAGYPSPCGRRLWSPLLYSATGQCALPISVRVPAAAEVAKGDLSVLPGCYAIEEANPLSDTTGVPAL